MGRALQIVILSLTSFICLDARCQQFSGWIIDQDSQPIVGATIQCTDKKVLSGIDGEFTIPCTLGPLIIYGEAIDTTRYILNGFVAPNDTIVITTHYSEISNVDIITKRMHYFDIGYIPPIKGVQIATGTNAIIETERQDGAKSTGNPRELFAKIPGLNIWESDGAGIQMGVGGRGLSPNRAANFNMRQNGYDISADALGYPESYYTPPLEALQSIEIIRGSASLQYGTQFGGLMNFMIKDPNKTPFEFTSRNTVGNYGYFGTFNRISGSKGRWEYQAYYQLKTGTGYRENANFSQHQGFAQLGYHINENHRVRLEYTHMSYLAKQPGGLTDKQFQEDPIQSVRDRNWFKVNWNILALHYDWKVSRNAQFNVRAFGMISSRYSLGYLGKINTADPGGNRDLIAGNFKNAGIEARYLKKYTFSKLKHHAGFLIGARYYQGITTSLQGTSTPGSDANFKFKSPNDLEHSNYSFPSQNLSIFTDNIWFIGPKWSVNAGFRFEYISSAANGYYKQYSIHPLNQDTLAVYTNYDNNQLSRYVPLGGVGVSYKLKKQMSVYTNYCMNYRAVNFNDIRIVNPNVVIDSAMRDEYGWTGELGVRGMLGKYFYVDVAGFALFYGDKIGLAPLPNSVKRIRTNIGDAMNLGVEFFTELDVLKMINDSSKIGGSIFVNCSYIDATYIRSREAGYIGKKVEYVSPILCRVGFKVRGKQWQVQVQGSYNAAQFTDATNSIVPSGDAVIGEIPAYYVVDLSARYAFKRYFQLEAGVTNLTNQSYFTRRATAYPGPGILPSDGIGFYGTLQFRFELKQ